MPGPVVGEVAPDFSLPRAPVKSYRLSDYRGSRRVVVSFLALAFTGGYEWGIEGTLRAFARAFDAFESRDTVILTITADSMYANEAFSRQLGGLPFPILADFLPRGAISREWGVWADEREHPRNVTILIDKNGVVQSVEHHKQGGAPDIRALIAAIDTLNDTPSENV